MSSPPSLAVELLYTALRSPRGLWVRTTDAHRLKYHLYNARRALDDPALGRLRLSHNPQDVSGEIWIINPPQEDDEPRA